MVREWQCWRGIGRTVTLLRVHSETSSSRGQPSCDHAAVRVVGLGAICDLEPGAIDNGREHSFRVSELVLLDNGKRVILHAERGYTSRISAGDIWTRETAGKVTRDVLTTVLPDRDDTADEHPWAWLAELAQARKIEVTADDLRQLPYEVVLTERVIQRLSTSASPSTDGP